MNNNITFFERFEHDILAGYKTITLRDEQESHFNAGQILQVATFEQNRWFCQIEVLNVEPITLDELSEVEAKAENMTLAELKQVITEIYPNQQHYFKISFRVIKN